MYLPDRDGSQQLGAQMFFVPAAISRLQLENHRNKALAGCQRFSGMFCIEDCCVPLDAGNDNKETKQEYIID